MIWLIMGIIVLAVFMFVAQPLYTKNAPAVEADSEVKDYLAQIDDIDTQLKNTDKSAGISLLELAKIELQRQVLAKPDAGKDHGPKIVLLSTLFITIAFGTMGLYTILGRPELTKTAALQKPVLSRAQDAATMTPEARQEMIKNMVAGFSVKLQENPNDPDAWVHLLRARKVMGAESTAKSEILVMRATFKDNPEMIQQILSRAGWSKNMPQ